MGLDINPGLFPDLLSLSTVFVKQSLAEPLPPEWNGSFDLVNQRFAMAAAMKTSLQTVIDNFVGVLNPCDWLQLTEMDGEAAEGDAMIRITGLLKGILTLVRGEPSITHATPALMENAGHMDVESRDSTVLVGHLWTGD